MNQFRTEYLEAFPQLIDLMVNIFFNSGEFGKTVTEVNIHERLLTNSRNQLPSLSRLYTRSKKGNLKINRAIAENSAARIGEK